MKIEWKYKIELNDLKVFDEIESKIGFIIPDSLRNIIINHNAASPNPSSIMIEGQERVFGAILSYNKNEEEADDVFTALEVIGTNSNELPFGIDPFGNYFCYSNLTKTITYWMHEENKFLDSNILVENFEDSLY